MTVHINTYLALWVLALVVSIWCVFTFVGLRYMVQMFPEGRRWWTSPAQWLSLAAFAAVVLWHPF